MNTRRSTFCRGANLVPVERIELADRRRRRRVRAQYLQRYAWACTLSAGSWVLDLAWGSGYGAAMPAHSGATEVVRADLDIDAVTAADAPHFEHGLRYVVQDATHAEPAGASFDIMMSFESIEHISDDGGYTSVPHRLLGPGGLAASSSTGQSSRDDFLRTQAEAVPNQVACDLDEGCPSNSSAPHS